MARQTAQQWGSEYFDHYTRFLRAPTASYPFEPPWGPVIQALTFDDVFQDVALAATLGVLHYARQVGGPAEVVLGIEGERPEKVAEILARSLFHVIQREVRLLPGACSDVLVVADSAWAAKVEKSALLFVEPIGFPEEFQQTPSGGQVLHAVPLSPAEHDYLKRHGYAALDECFRAANVDPFLATRQCLFSQS